MNSTVKFKKVMDLLNKHDLCNNTLNHSFFERFGDDDFFNEKKIIETINEIKLYEKRAEEKPNKYSEKIMGAVRQNLGYGKYDTSRDEYINAMSEEEVLDRVCNWNCLVGFGSTIINWIEDIYKVDLSKHQ